MGSPVSAVVANLYMESFEELALRSAPAKPRLCTCGLCKVYMRDVQSAHAGCAKCTCAHVDVHSCHPHVDDSCCILKKSAMEGLDPEPSQQCENIHQVHCGSGEGWKPSLS